MPAEGQGAGQGVLLPAGFSSNAPPRFRALSVEENSDDQTFRWVASAAHPDLLTVERRFDEKRGRQLGEIVVDDVRRIAAFLGSSPALGGGWRVVIVDAADEMNRNAANALLKVLEEPNNNSASACLSPAEPASTDGPLTLPAHRLAAARRRRHRGVACPLPPGHRRR
ncbi:MAG: hypothetical protein U1E35_08285 [Rhodospirillales bacterium]